ncbi:11319_t:CDS:2 [Entrophospora sp. SA101]|nr:4878_t:CDS:2 [Entrophospora sp. SA101]CAH1758734.1 4882_t:CDS:2 [Entrophospora sp. SA101]CAJ0828597.1 4300_t:CDS:2 [Entrophospora sp. SA101]CAJ0832177.1 8793_t:CDS:2 [Entrophospora sp. SA101]CAJ0841290.1 11316_t:CDS:2 [Entrophospora sp. SA101]
MGCAYQINISTACYHCNEIAIERKGLCLSNKYINSHAPLEWSCAKNHKWKAQLSNVKNGNWCPSCSRVGRRTLEDAKQVAHNRNGECLSKTFVNIRLLLLWRCIKGHTWYANLSHVKNTNTWCPHCAGNIRSTIEEAKQIAYSKNGNCLSEKYVNCQAPLQWRCAKGHEWNANLNHIKHNRWCPFCRNKYEDLCRKIITEYLKPPSKIWEYPYGLELDIYYPEYGLAIEVQGEQHERYLKFFHRDQNGFKKQLYRDQLKKELCEENWIVLRYIWYYEDLYVVIPEHPQELGLTE